MPEVRTGKAFWYGSFQEPRMPSSWLKLFVLSLERLDLIVLQIKNSNRRRGVDAFPVEVLASWVHVRASESA